MTSLAKATKNLMINDLMNETGWTRNRVVAAIEELERAKLVRFNPQGDLQLKVDVEVF